MNTQLPIIVRLSGMAMLIYTYTASGTEMAITIGQSQNFSPCLEMHMPPAMPPAMRPIMPMTPLMKPISPLSSPRPPAATLSIKKSLPIFPNCASGKRKRSRNRMDAAIPGLEK